MLADLCGCTAVKPYNFDLINISSYGSRSEMLSHFTKTQKCTPHGGMRRNV